MSAGVYEPKGLFSYSLLSLNCHILKTIHYFLNKYIHKFLLNKFKIEMKFSFYFKNQNK